MTKPSTAPVDPFATLQARWGPAALRRGRDLVIGSLAVAPAPDETPDEGFGAGPRDASAQARAEPVRQGIGRVVPTGFAALDAILGPGGIPRTATAALRGDHSSGKTTLALSLAARAQAEGAIVAYLDLARAFDPVEAVARGVRLDWLVVLVPDSLGDGLAMAGSLLQGRTVDLLLVDLPSPLSPGRAPAHPLATYPAPPGGGPRLTGPGGRSAPPGGRPARPGDQLLRLVALARRVESLLVLLEPPGLPEGIRGAAEEAAGLRLELQRRSWLRLGRDVVGQRTDVLVARNRFGPPGRHAELQILYAEGGDRDGCLSRPSLLSSWTGPSGDTARRPAHPVAITAIGHASPASLLATSPSPARTGSTRAHELRALPARAADPGRAALG